MISGRRTGMRALVRRLYIPLGPLVTVALIPSNIRAHYTWTAADSKWTTARLARRTRLGTIAACMEKED